MPSPRSEFISGIKAQLPILLGTFPFGVIYGALALEAGLTPGAALAMSSIVFAGSSQFIAVSLFRDLALIPVIVLTAFVVNLRHLLYSASIAPHVRHLRSGWKWLLAYLLTDEAYAVTITHYHAAEDSLPHQTHRHWFYLGAGLTLWTNWQLSTAIGVFLGRQIPDSWALDFTVPLTFIALVVPALKDRPNLAAAIAAGIVALLGAGWPYRLGLMAAALTGIAVGLWLETRQSGALHLPRSTPGESPHE